MCCVSNSASEEDVWFLRKASMRYMTVGLKVNNKFSVSDLSLDLQIIARH